MDIVPTTESGIITVLLFTNLVQLILQVAQMFFDSKKENQQSQITSLREDLKLAVEKIAKQDVKIETLQNELFEVKKKESYYQGRLEALELLENQQVKKLEGVLAKRRAND
jgi:peptidoglycan hydrolase CwlO-like protein